MRLIDADKLILHLNDYALQEAPFGRNDGKNQKEIYDTIQECMKAVEEQPTAFDVEKVIEILGILREESTHVSCPDEECEDCKYFGDCNDCDYADVHALDKAIEIVKRGGIEEE